MQDNIIRTGDGSYIVQQASVARAMKYSDDGKYLALCDGIR